MIANQIKQKFGIMIVGAMILGALFGCPLKALKRLLFQPPPPWKMFFGLVLLQTLPLLFLSREDGWWGLWLN